MSVIRAETLESDCEEVFAGLAPGPVASMLCPDAACKLEAASGLVYCDSPSHSFPTAKTVVGDQDYTERSSPELRRRGSNLSLKDNTKRQRLARRASDRRNDASRRDGALNPISMFTRSISGELTGPSESSEHLEKELKEFCDLEIFLGGNSDSSKVSAPKESESPVHRPNLDSLVRESEVSDIAASGKNGKEQPTPENSMVYPGIPDHEAWTSQRLEISPGMQLLPRQPARYATSPEKTLRRVSQLNSHLWSKILVGGKLETQQRFEHPPERKRAMFCKSTRETGHEAVQETIENLASGPALAEEKLSFEQGCLEADSADLNQPPVPNLLLAVESSHRGRASASDEDVHPQVNASTWVDSEGVHPKTGQTDTYMLDHNPKPQTTTKKKGILMKNNYSHNVTSSLFPTSTEIEQLQLVEDRQSLPQSPGQLPREKKKRRVVFNPFPAISLVSRYIKTSRPRKSLGGRCCCTCTLI